MDGLHIFIIVLLGVVSCSNDSISGSVLEVSVRPGDNITLYCDCKLSTGVYIVWYRNCSHENQPPLVLKVKLGNFIPKTLKHFDFFKNVSSESYDLFIMNITESDEGLYYCGTETIKVEDKEYITQRHLYTYGNVTTRIIFNSSPNPDSAPTVSWMVVFAPAFTILSSFISFILLYHFCQKAAQEPQVLQKRPDTTGKTSWDQDEDLCLTRVVFRAKDGQTHR
ncbi:uncharacterized protein LOC131969603 isoform X1 [Centropristis striata]|uniref:uncharacterized protein LOC131969603 isoform X1 n=1 Tax=Centropristis striata TaxID=184440 RepID=UPI0027DEE2A1|nr:uncharacterized protein LOC131969603 isoform X1 [Centropristis striata]